MLKISRFFFIFIVFDSHGPIKEMFINKDVFFFFHKFSTVGSAKTLESGDKLSTGLCIASIFSQPSWRRVGKGQTGCAVIGK